MFLMHRTLVARARAWAPSMLHSLSLFILLLSNAVGMRNARIQDYLFSLGCFFLIFSETVFILTVLTTFFLSFESVSAREMTNPIRCYIGCSKPLCVLAWAKNMMKKKFNKLNLSQRTENCIFFKLGILFANFSHFFYSSVYHSLARSPARSDQVIYCRVSRGFSRTVDILSR